MANIVSQLPARNVYPVNSSGAFPAHILMQPLAHMLQASFGFVFQGASNALSASESSVHNAKLELVIDLTQQPKRCI